MAACGRRDRAHRHLPAVQRRKPRYGARLGACPPPPTSHSPWASWALLGNRVPSGVRVFLSTLAVADDIIAILVIAIFYGHRPSLFWLGAAASVLVALVLMNRIHIYSLVPYLLVGGVLWNCVFMSGVHSTIAGVLLAFVIPSGSRVNLKSFTAWSGDKVREAHDAFQPETPVIAQGDYIETVSSLSRVARQVVPPRHASGASVVPVGVLRNTAPVRAHERRCGLCGHGRGRYADRPCLVRRHAGPSSGQAARHHAHELCHREEQAGVAARERELVPHAGRVHLGRRRLHHGHFRGEPRVHRRDACGHGEAGHYWPPRFLAGVLGFVFLLLQAKAAQRRGVAYLSASGDDVARQTGGRRGHARCRGAAARYRESGPQKRGGGGEEARRRVRDRG